MSFAVIQTLKEFGEKIHPNSWTEKIQGQPFYWRSSSPHLKGKLMTDSNEREETNLDTSAAKHSNLEESQCTSWNFNGHELLLVKVC